SSLRGRRPPRVKLHAICSGWTDRGPVGLAVASPEAPDAVALPFFYYGGRTGFGLLSAKKNAGVERAGPGRGAGGTSVQGQARRPVLQHRALVTGEQDAADQLDGHAALLDEVVVEVFEGVGLALGLPVVLAQLVDLELA